jgi:hypothetical protein
MIEIDTDMKKNFERINYSLRPAKHIERKMFCEAFGRLSILDDIKNYRYIGMGSAYFSDFSLFHKTLGITKLVSIEGEDDKQAKERIKFNKPFACIDVEFGWTTRILPILPWQKWEEKSIVWLDYVDKLNEEMLGDIETVIFNVKPGSVFVISVNIEEDDERDEKENKRKMSAKEFRLKKLKENVGSESIPRRAFDLILNIENNKSVIREIIHNAFLSAIRKRNSGVTEIDEIEYKQLFNLHYKDSADMLTVGGIIYTKKEKEKVDEMFEHLGFIRDGSTCFNIVVPKLTYREIHALDKVLPQLKSKTSKGIKSDITKIPLSQADKKDYENIYRYFPTFAETNL